MNFKRVMRVMAEEKRVALAAKEAAQKLGYNDTKACQLQVIEGIVSDRDVFAILPTGEY